MFEIQTLNAENTIIWEVRTLEMVIWALTKQESVGTLQLNKANS
jgi:hypothetical protein